MSWSVLLCYNSKQKQTLMKMKSRAHKGIDQAGRMKSERCSQKRFTASDYIKGSSKLKISAHIREQINWN